jgi:hypothetical protein
MYRYYLTQRPPVPGAVPKMKGMEIEDYGSKQYVGGGMHAWGHVDYKKELVPEVARRYELKYGGPVR